jgi:deoxyribonuclease-4
MEDKVRFGPSGNSAIFYEAGNTTSLQAPAWLKSVGLDAYEYSFGRGYNMGSETAAKLGEEVERNDIRVSAHAPYYINLANESEEMILKSYGYVMTGLKMLRLMKGKYLVFHVASQGKQSREKALELIRTRLAELVKLVYENGYGDMYICPETMGKNGQIGTYEEIIDLCTLDKILIPTFDFGHIYAFNNGRFGTYDDYKKVFSYSIEKLGFEKTKKCHIHFSKIEYSGKGEVRHLNYSDENFGPNFEPLARVIHELKLTPTIICESANRMAEDALEFKRIYTEKN